MQGRAIYTLRLAAGRLHCLNIMPRVIMRLRSQARWRAFPPEAVAALLEPLLQAPATVAKAIFGPSLGHRPQALQVNALMSNDPAANSYRTTTIRHYWNLSCLGLWKLEQPIRRFS